MYCRVYSDGSHYIAKPVIKANKTEERTKSQSKINGLVDNIFYSALSNDIKIKSKEMFDFVKDNLQGIVEVDNIDEFVISQINRCRKNLYLRKRRFERKINLNQFNYMITISYDSRLHTEESFIKCLKKCLSNFSTRRGWRVAGAFERGKNTNRLHFHAWLYIPDGQKVGDFTLIRDYDIKNHCMQTRNQNSFFFDRFGINDFKIIPPNISKSSSLYITKYIGKSNERIFYSRHLPEFLEQDISKEDIIVETFFFVTEYILYDDVFKSNNDDFKIDYSYFDYLVS